MTNKSVVINFAIDLYAKPNSSIETSECTTVQITDPGYTGVSLFFGELDVEFVLRSTPVHSYRPFTCPDDYKLGSPFD
jgi:hypothetical protein